MAPGVGAQADIEVEGSPSDEADDERAGRGKAATIDRRHLLRAVQGCMKAWSTVGDRVATKTKVEFLKHVANLAIDTSDGCAPRSRENVGLMEAIEELNRASNEERRACLEDLPKDFTLSGECQEVRDAAREWVEKALPESIVAQMNGFATCIDMTSAGDASSSSAMAADIHKIHEQLGLVMRENVSTLAEQLLAKEIRQLLATDKVLEGAVGNAMELAASGWLTGDARAPIAELKTNASYLAGGQDTDALRSAYDAVSLAFADVKLKAAAPSDAKDPQSAKKEDLRKALCERVKGMSEPLVRDINALKKQILEAQEQLHAVTQLNGGHEPATSEHKQDSIQKLCARGAFEEAFGLAVGSDSSGELAEFACQEVVLSWELGLTRSGGGSSTAACAEAFLAQEPKPLSMELTLRLTVSLMQGCTRKAASLEQLHNNLDWVLALLGTLEPMKDGGGQTVESVAAALQKAAEPPSLAAATSEEQRRVSKKARLVSKQFALLCSA